MQIIRRRVCLSGFGNVLEKNTVPVVLHNRTVKAHVYITYYDYVPQALQSVE